MKQATANKNAAQAEIAKRTELFDKAVATQRQSEETIIQAENDLARVKKGIESTNEQINSIRKKIDELASLMEKKRLERASLIEGLGKAKVSLKEVENQLRNERENLEQAEMDLADKEAECDGVNKELETTEDELTNKKMEKAALGVNINSVEERIVDEQAAIDELKRQLAAAENALKGSKAQLAGLKEE